MPVTFPFKLVVPLAMLAACAQSTPSRDELTKGALDDTAALPDSRDFAAAFEDKDLALRINALVRDPNKARRMGEAARERVEAKFSWSAIAQQTYDLYQAAIERHKAETRQS